MGGINKPSPNGSPSDPSDRAHQAVGDDLAVRHKPEVTTTNGLISMYQFYLFEAVKI